MRVLLVLLGLGLAASACRGPEPAPPAASPAPTALPTAEPTPEPRPADPFELAASYDVATPEELARRLVAAETAIRSSGTPEAEVEAHARVQQAAYRQLVREPEWVPVALERVPEELRRVVELHVEAGAELRALTSPREELPAHWAIVEPPAPDELRGYYDSAEAEFGVHWSYLAAIHLVETRMGRIRGTSVAGAEGPMQFMPATWAAYGEGDINDPHDAIRAAARYLVAHGAPGDMPRALFAYNRSRRYVRAITIHAEQIQADARLHLAYHHWQVYYRTTRGDALLEPGWGT